MVLLVAGFMIATQFFFTLCLIAVIVSLCLVLLFFLCAGPDQKHFVLLIKVIGWILLGAGICGAIAVIVFACFGNKDKWMPEHANNFFGRCSLEQSFIHGNVTSHVHFSHTGWSFGLGVVGAVMCFIASTLFLTEATVQAKKQRQFKESQTRFEMERETKA